MTDEEIRYVDTRQGSNSTLNIIQFTTPIVCPLPKNSFHADNEVSTMPAVKKEEPSRLRTITGWPLIF